ncbi:CRISPR-associated protein Cmr4 [Pokkaliibacter plantistimulans]|uniref:CRISPR-associated protein Cmr4 n=1 Tax=Pokkaliibacter plantistimulans TaxID=1635171 RepID=A0ABX5M2P8_9GAMM|nr:type III-B CRISPR module RAMP protein Cmr4 [Pokkaliibacter plantistimulans]PXF31851.1 CRISPR-associated protein Cmr4 [Pokkaliibacter plantistimulans]
MKHQMLGLFAETAIHAGAGKSVGVIDLPIQREATTGWPCVFGSAVKGALRAKAESTDNGSWITEVFGPDTRNASDHAGALMVGDARLLLLPIRSLTTHFKWVCSPAVLQRMLADARRAGLPDLPEVSLPELGAEEALQAAADELVYLEEYRFNAKSHDLSSLITVLARFSDQPDFAAQLQKQLMVVNDNIFAHLASHATPVAPHIAIDNKSKTVKDGALWYEETLPAQTLLYTVLAANRSRKVGGENAEQMMAHTLSLFPQEAPYVQLGGNETVGMGWCRVTRVGGV